MYGRYQLLPPCVSSSKQRDQWKTTCAPLHAGSMVGVSGSVRFDSTGKHSTITCDAAFGHVGGAAVARAKPCSKDGYVRRTERGNDKGAISSVVDPAKAFVQDLVACGMAMGNIVQFAASNSQGLM